MSLESFYYNKDEPRLSCLGEGYLSVNLVWRMAIKARFQHWFDTGMV